MPIQLLSPEVADQIAAGEVIERPASVVKELIENALDAGADRVAVEVRGGGIELIRVVDNGRGIPAGEAPLALLRHATSKLRAASDLRAIQTLGFRGEALASLAAVADLTLTTRPAEQAEGLYLRARPGAAPESAARGTPVGTSLTVRDLFATLPARRQFLRSPASETGAIVELVSQQALAQPAVQFRLTVDGRETLSTPGNGDLRAAAGAVYGPTIAQALLEIAMPAAEGEDAPCRVQGLIGPPSVHRTNRNDILLYVNRRRIQHRSLAFAIEEAYRNLLPVRRFPLAILHLRVRPEEVDVNVHPAKLEVRFLRERAVFAVVREQARATLAAQAPIPRLRVAEPEPRPAARPTLWTRSAVPALPALHRPTPTESEAADGHGRLPALRVLGQSGLVYIITEGPDGLYLVDQHAAHERVLFERFQAQRRAASPEQQGLLVPEVVSLTAGQEQWLARQGEALTRLGFVGEPFGPRAWALRAVPSLLRDGAPGPAFLAILEALAAGELPGVEDPAVATLACHAAVRAGQPLLIEEMRAIIEQLERCELPRTCPHGRPTALHLSAAQLERQFGRR